VAISIVIAIINAPNVENQFLKSGINMATKTSKYTNNHCPLCNLNLKEEIIYGEYGPFLVLRTKDLKGHRERIMIVHKRHVHNVEWKEFEAAIEFLIEIGKKAFDYAPKFVIMDTTFATITEHWHLVCTDLDPKSDDFQQILGTKWIKVVDRMWDT